MKTWEDLHKGKAHSALSAIGLFHFLCHAKYTEDKSGLGTKVWATSSVKTGRRVIYKRKIVNAYISKEDGESLNWKSMRIWPE